MLQNQSGDIETRSGLKSSILRSTIDFTNSILIPIKKKINTGDFQTQGVGTLPCQDLDHRLQGEGFSSPSPGDVGFEAPVDAATQHRTHHVASDDPHPQILPGPIADVVLKDQTS
jgi:hypothetical protein